MFVGLFIFTFHLFILKPKSEKRMLALVKILQQEQAQLNYSLTDNDAYEHLLRTGYVVATGIDMPFNNKSREIEANGLLRFDLGKLTVFATKNPPQSGPLLRNRCPWLPWTNYVTLSYFQITWILWSKCSVCFDAFPWVLRRLAIHSRWGSFLILLPTQWNPRTSARWG